MAHADLGFGQAENAASGSRDLRIDFIRGLSLWMIFVDHIPGDLLSHITYRHVALSDALDIFVLLSGMSCCLLYAKLIRTVGFAEAQMRALHRLRQIYVGYLCVGLATVAFYFAFRSMLDDSYLIANDLTLLANEPLRAVSAMVWLLYTPQYMNILPLYMVLVAVAPAMICLLMRSNVLAFAVSASLWLAAAVAPQLNVPSLNTLGVAALNPLSWQLLFFIGLWAGARYFVDGVPFRAVPGLQALCWIALIAGALARHATWFGFAELTSLSRESASYQAANEHIVPLLNLLAGAYLTACYLPAGAALLRSKWLSPLLICGRHSLEVFCVGVALSTLGAMIFRLYGTALAIQIAVNGTGLAILTAVAVALERKRTRAPRPIEVLEAIGEAPDQQSSGV